MSTLGSVILRDVIANRPAAAIPGRLFFASDTLVNYRDNGTTWDVYSGGGTGSVSSVAMTVPTRQTVAGSPIVGAGTLAVTDNNQNANLVFAGPSSGGATTPTFRVLVSADLPSGTVINFADNETPTGLINSSNVTYTLAHTPNPSASLQLFSNGALQRSGAGNDYTLSVATITMLSAPTTGGSLVASYRY